MKLTKRAIDQASYEGNGTSRDVPWDNGLPGFGLRLYPSGRKTFVVFYRTEARQRLMVVGTYGVLTLQQARDKAKKILIAARDGDDPLRKRQNAARASTVADFAEHYLERHAKPRKKTWQADERRIRQYIVPAMGRLPLEKVSRDDVGRLYSEIGKTKPYEANRVLALLSTMFNLAISWELLPAGSGNPAKIPRGTRFQEKSRDRPVTSDELPKLMASVAEEEDPFVRAAVHLYLLTGLRKRELLNARWQDIDFGRGTLRLVDTKAGRPRHVPLSRAALEILGELPQMVGSPYVFASPSKEDAPRVDLFKPWRRIRRRAGCRDLRIHDLRHSVATWLADEGHAAQFIQQALGHQSLQTTMKYIHAASAGPR